MRIFWKLIFVLYASFVIIDLISLPSQRPIIPMAIGSLLGLLAAIPMFGYAFRIQIGSARVWRILFRLQILGFVIAFGALIVAHIPTEGWTREFSPHLLLVFPAAFLIMFPWHQYAYRSPEIWRKGSHPEG